MAELEEFHKDFMQEIYARADSNEAFLETEFIDETASRLTYSGEIDGFECCQYRAERGMRVDGYWLGEDDEDDTLCLFICDLKNTSSPCAFTNTEVQSTFKRLENFFSKSLDSDFHQQLEETSPGYGLAYHIYSKRNSFSKVRMFLFTDALLSSRVLSIENKTIKGFPTSFSVWDIGRLHRLESAKEGKEEILIDLEERYGTSLPVLPAHLESDSYKAYLAVIPASILSDLYDEYGSRLLEQNVRCFLQARGKVNVGIRSTIINKPEMFFAYNNGITATAQEVLIEQNNGTAKLKWMRNFQIVNGGQTTASLFNAKKKNKADLSKIFVQMKLSIIDAEDSIQVVHDISKYANSQNKVNAADFFANHPFHLRIEDFSRRIWAPSKDGSQKETKWFYERARGQYAEAQAHATPAGKKKFQLEFPKPQMFTKTDLAKFENVWEIKPHIVCRGSEYNFSKFAEEIGGRWEKDDKLFNELYFKHIVAKAIIFRTLEKLIMQQTWYDGGYRAQIVAYTLSYIGDQASELKLSVNFTKIWNDQKVSSIFHQELERVSKAVHEALIDTPQGVSNVTQWAKKEGCWTKIRWLGAGLSKPFIGELIRKEDVFMEKKDAGKIQEIDNGIEAQKAVVEMSKETLGDMLQWGIQEKIVTSKDVDLLRVATNPFKLPSELQAKAIMRIINKLRERGYQDK